MISYQGKITADCHALPHCLQRLSVIRMNVSGNESVYWINTLHVGKIE